MSLSISFSNCNITYSFECIVKENMLASEGDALPEDELLGQMA